MKRFLALLILLFAAKFAFTQVIDSGRRVDGLNPYFHTMRTDSGSVSVFRADSIYIAGQAVVQTGIFDSVNIKGWTKQYTTSYGNKYKDSLGISRAADLLDIGGDGSLKNEFNAAVAARTPGYGWYDIRFPGGNYDLGNANMKFSNKDSIRIWGYGTSLSTTANSNIMQFDSSDGLRIYGVRFVGKHKNSTTQNQHGVQVRFSTDVKIENCIFDSVTIGVGIIGDSNNVSPTRISKDIKIVNNEFNSNNDPYSATFGTAIFFFKNVQYGEISGNLIRNGYDGIALDDATSSDTSYRATKYIDVHDNVIHNMSNAGIKVEGSRLNHVHDNTIDGMGRYGIYNVCTQSPEGADSNTYDHNFITGGRGDGMYISGSSFNVISTNWIWKIDTTNAGAGGVGIRIIRTDSGSTIYGSKRNRIVNNQVWGNRLLGIYIQNTQDSLNFISYNECYDNGTAPSNNISAGVSPTFIGINRVGDVFTLNGDTLTLAKGLMVRTQGLFGDSVVPARGSVVVADSGKAAVRVDGADFTFRPGWNGIYENQGGEYLQSRDNWYIVLDNDNDATNKAFRIYSNGLTTQRFVMREDGKAIFNGADTDSGAGGDSVFYIANNGSLHVGGKARFNNYLDGDSVTYASLSPPGYGHGRLVFQGQAGIRYVYPDGHSVNLDSVLAAGVGEANTASNVSGAGVGIFKQKTSVDLQFKRLKAGSNITVTDNTDSVTIAASTAGETNTASNLAGAGVGVWKDKSSVDLRFKRLKAGSNVTITDQTDSVLIASSATAADTANVSRRIDSLRAGTTTPDLSVMWWWWDDFASPRVVQNASSATVSSGAISEKLWDLSSFGTGSGTYISTNPAMPGAADSNRYGIMSMLCGGAPSGASARGAWVTTARSNAYGFLPMKQSWAVKAAIKTPVLSDSLCFVLGVVDTATAHDITAGFGTGIYFSLGGKRDDGSIGRKDSLFGVTSNGTTKTQTALMAVSLNTWYDLKITRNTTGGIEFYVNDVLKGTNTATLPPTTGTQSASSPFFGLWNYGPTIVGGSYTWYIDYYGLRLSNITR